MIREEAQYVRKTQIGIFTPIVKIISVGQGCVIVSQDVRKDSAIEVGRRLHDLVVTCSMAIRKPAQNVTLFRLLTHRDGRQIAVSKVHRSISSYRGPRQAIRPTVVPIDIRISLR